MQNRTRVGFTEQAEEEHEYGQFVGEFSQFGVTDEQQWLTDHAVSHSDVKVMHLNMPVQETRTISDNESSSDNSSEISFEPVVQQNKTFEK